MTNAQPKNLLPLGDVEVRTIVRVTGADGTLREGYVYGRDGDAVLVRCADVELRRSAAETAEVILTPTELVEIYLLTPRVHLVIQHALLVQRAIREAVEEVYGTRS